MSKTAAITLCLAPAVAASGGLEGHRSVRIVGGVEATKSEFPFYTSIEDNGYSFCGGSLVKEDWVLSAAHCSAGVTPLYTQARVNAYELKSYDAATEERRDIARVVNHPQYNTDNHVFDVAVYKLDQVITITSGGTIKLIKIQDTNTFIADNAVGTPMTVCGLGVLNTDDQQSPEKLMEVVVNLVATDYCSTQYSEYLVGTDTLPAEMFCAAASGKDSCQGDSGGPLFIAKSASDSSTFVDYEQVGVVSWGVGCARPEFPGVYAKISQTMINTLADTTEPPATAPQPTATAPQPTATLTSPPQSSFGTPTCNEECIYFSGDGVCDDGGAGSVYDVCLYGTDCIDCGDRLNGTTTKPGCNYSYADACQYAMDGMCDDGRTNDADLLTAPCNPGTDCFDCGPPVVSCGENEFPAYGSKDCTPCAQGSTSVPGSAGCTCTDPTTYWNPVENSCQTILCSPGHQLDQGSVGCLQGCCKPCGENTFHATGLEAHECTPCVQGSTSAVGSTNCTCSDPTTYWNPDDNTCGPFPTAAASPIPTAAPSVNGSFTLEGDFWARFFDNNTSKEELELELRRDLGSTYNVPPSNVEVSTGLGSLKVDFRLLDYTATEDTLALNPELSSVQNLLQPSEQIRFAQNVSLSGSGVAEAQEQATQDVASNVNPGPAPAPPVTPTSSSSSSSSVGIIAGAAAGGAVALCIIIGVVAFCCCRRSDTEQQQREAEPISSPVPPPTAPANDPAHELYTPANNDQPTAPVVTEPFYDSVVTRPSPSEGN